MCTTLHLRFPIGQFVWRSASVGARSNVLARLWLWHRPGLGVWVLKLTIWERSWWMAYFGVVWCGAMLVLLLLELLELLMLELLMLMLLYCVALGLAGLVVSTPRRAHSCVLLLYHTHINQSTLSSPSEELALPGGPWAKMSPRSGPCPPLQPLSSKFRLHITPRHHLLRRYCRIGPYTGVGIHSFVRHI